MSKLEELIEQYCPDGVEYMKIGEVCKALPKGTLTTKELVEPNGHNYPVINSGRELYGYYTHFNNEGDAFTVAARGEYAGFITYFSGKFWAGGLCYPYRSYSPNISTKFIFYYLKTRQEYIRNTLVAEGSIPALNKGTLDLFEIPVPPLPVQEEIVRILDAFTELQAELQAELQKRKQQYNYYLDNLLNFKNINRGGYQAEVRWMKIGDICDVFTGGEVPMGSIKGNTSFGSFIYPIWGNGKDIYGYATTYQIDKDAVCISSIGANSGAVFFHKSYFTPIIRLKVLIPRNQGISVRYLFYILSFVGFDVKKSSVPNMNSNEVKQKVIPIPSLVEQQRIVSILDRFDTLTTDLTQGLPAEIEKRRQQYEYYRDKLMTFKRKGA